MFLLRDAGRGVGRDVLRDVRRDVGRDVVRDVGRDVCKILRFIIFGWEMRGWRTEGEELSGKPSQRVDPLLSGREGESSGVE